MTFTKNEQAVFNLIAGLSFGGGIADIDDVVAGTGLDAKSARGVIASLVKKGRVEVEEFKTVFDSVQYHYWPHHSDHGGFIFWGDHMRREEYEAELIKDEQVVN